MDARLDSVDKIKERNVNGDERKRGRIDRCAEKAAILSLDEGLGEKYRSATAGSFWITGSNEGLMIATNSKSGLCEDRDVVKRLSNVNRTRLIRRTYCSFLTFGVHQC